MSSELRLIPFCKGSATSPAHVVFVHGLGGHPVGTWSCTGDEKGCWPNWLASDLPQLGVWSLGYPAEATRWTSEGPGMALPDRAASVLDFLHSHGLSRLPLVFVVHSLGGLLIKQLLRTSSEMAHPDAPAFHKQTRGVVFLGTPHSGAGLATFAAMLPLFRPGNPATDLQAHSPYLRDLGHWYSAQAEKYGIRTAAYYETQSVRGVFVVNPTTADPGVPACLPIPVDADHFELSKPKDRMSPVYLSVRAFLSDLQVGGASGDAPRKAEEAQKKAAEGVWPQVRFSESELPQAIISLLDRSRRPWLTEATKPLLATVMAELALNAFRHGRATWCELGAYEASLVLRDNGRHFDPTSALPTLRDGRYGAGLVVVRHFCDSHSSDFSVQHFRVGKNTAGIEPVNEVVFYDRARDTPREEGSGFAIIRLRHPAPQTQASAGHLSEIFDIPPGEVDYVLDLDKTDFGLLTVFISFAVELIHVILQRLPLQAKLHVRYRNADLLDVYVSGYSELGHRVVVHPT